jgi:SAM-dependent methyltransferase
MNCRISNKKLNLVNDFGKQPLGNGFLKEENFRNEYFYKMQTGFCTESKMFQLIEQPNPEKMFHENYPFFSSTSKNMQNHFSIWAEEILKNLKNNNKAFVVELGCNDGIFLQYFAQNKIKHLGIEPSKNVAEIAKKKNIKVKNEFFNLGLVDQIIKESGNVDYFISANVMCHIPNILEVVEGIERLLNRDGILVFEDPYLGDVINKTTYDQIYDEHVFLFSAHSVSFLFEKFGMELIKLEPQNTHGGSMRYTLGKKNRHKKDFSVNEYLNIEKKNGIENYDRMLDFNKSILKRKRELNKVLNELKNKNINICGYAATSKSTTILNFCEINNKTIDCIFDTTDIKIGRFSPGAHIPIKNMNEFQKENYKYTVLFAWNHAKEIFSKEVGYKKRGGKWIVFSPEIQII